MAYKTTTKFLTLIILSLLVNRVVNEQQFIPGPRTGHTATLIGDKIYYMGGYNRGNLTNDFFYLKLNTIETKFSWVDLKSQGVKFPLTAWGTSNIGGANTDSIFMIGGIQSETTNLVYRFDTKTNAIDTPVIQGNEPPRRRDINSVSYGGKIYIFTGDGYGNSSNTSFYNFDILDTINMNWQVGSLVNAPIPRFWYTATLVDKVIYYIGGMLLNATSGKPEFVLMSDIYQYDIIGNTWTFKTASAVKFPGQRVAHSAVLVNGKICIYGGLYYYLSFDANGGNEADAMPPPEPIAMLDTTTLEWSIPQVQNPNIPAIFQHTATLIGNSMLISFGNITTFKDDFVSNDKFYLFDLSKPIVTWENYTAQEIGGALPNTNRYSPISKTIIILFIVIGSIAVCLIGVIIFFGYKYYQKRGNKQKFTKHAVDFM